ncbi:hypothetical protein EG028_14270 [Chitinophaga barathri]|uniref:Uncharacterized protein n=2 Tax=Chitinophaga barathri TaxID=1647451 RepID=A0A3N4MFL5_9BACT|nr:hypothetical protein EG028_14270 [Chitinophaga barathri]
MDYMTTAQEKDYLLSLRIRSPRAKKRALREDREKQLLGLERELSTISTLQHNMGYVPLDPPIMRGWKRTFVLRADVAAGTKAAFYQGILDKLNVCDYHHSRKFTTTKRIKGRKVKIEKPLAYPDPYHWTIHKYKFSEAELKEFCLEERFKDGAGGRFVYVFREKWRFVLKVTPNMITEAKVESTALEARKAWIDNYLERNHFRHVLHKLLGHRRRFKCPSRRQQMQLKNQVPKNTLQWMCSLDD